uniref:Uncharacterized protein n=1 Tax=Anguilla anguilla TaxID=7936 RepID=A0A0E9RU91_ANGAN
MWHRSSRLYSVRYGYNTQAQSLIPTFFPLCSKQFLTSNTQGQKKCTIGNQNWGGRTKHFSLTAG